MKEIKWGMIGCGDVTEKKSAPSFNKISQSSLHGVTSRRMESAVSYAKRHDITRVYNSAAEMIRDPEINAIYVATPPSSHAEYAIMAMNGGKPVYVEKPMAKNYRECLEMNRVSEKTGIPLFVAYYRRSMEYFLKVRELLGSNVIGKPLLAHSRLFLPPRPEDMVPGNLPWRVIPEISGGGYFHDMACHELDLLLYYFGDIEEAYGNAVNRGGLYEPQDTVAASLKFTNGVVYTGSWSFISSDESYSDIIEIIGEKGKIEFSCFGFTPIRLKASGISEEFSIKPPQHVQYPMIRQVVEELLGISISPSKGESATKTSWVMDKILGEI
jgi:1,5-anhydro-D-fructose reductase (1,5-anhydro-D-mannitol-forming)